MERRFASADVDDVLNVLELFELAWHDCYGEVSPPEDVVDDVLLLSDGGLSDLIASVRLAVTDWRDVKVAADEARQRES